MAGQQQLSFTDKIKRALLLLIITGVFGALIIIMSKSFELSRKNVPETASGGVKKIHKEYLAGINMVFLLYIYFLVMCYIVFSWIEGFVIFLLLFVAINFALSFALMVMSADSLNKIKNDNEVPEDVKDDYKKLMTFIVTISTISTAVWGLPLFVIVGGFIVSMVSGKKQKQN
jgi:uncharacterized protein YpmB